MTYADNAYRKGFWLFWIFAAILLFWHAGSYGVVETSDARYAEIGREMLLSGDWLHPDLLQIHHYHKPPITYQLTALGYALWGIDPFGARFFLQVAVLIQLWLLFHLAFALFEDSRVALWSSIIYFTFPLVQASARNLTTDAYLTTFVLASLYAWVRYRQSGRAVWLYGFTLALGLGFLTKGPVVFLVPALFALLYNRLEPSKRDWSVHHILAWGFFFVVAGSWFVYLAAENPSFWDYFIGRQTVERFSSDVFHRSEPFWYFLLFAPLAGLPWLPLLPWLVWQKRELLYQKRLERVLLGAAVVTILFFSLSASKRIFYILPLYSVLALLTASLLKESDAKTQNWLWRMTAGYALLLVALFAFLPLLPVPVRMPPVFSLWALAGAVALWLISHRLRNLAQKSVAASFVAGVLFLTGATTILAHNPQLLHVATPVAQWLKSHHLDDRLVLVYDRRLPSLAFELDRSIVSLYDGDRSLNRETQFETDDAWKETLYNLKNPADVERLKTRLAHRKAVLVLYKKSLPAQRAWLKSYFKRSEKLGKWEIYY